MKLSNIILILMGCLFVPRMVLANEKELQVLGLSALEFIANYPADKIPKIKLPEELKSPKKWTPEITDADCVGVSNCSEYLKIQQLSKEEYAAIRNSYVLEGADLDGLRKSIFNRTLGQLITRISKSRKILNKSNICSDSTVYLNELVKLCNEKDENNGILNQRFMTWGFCFSTGIIGCWKERRRQSHQEECD